MDENQQTDVQEPEVETGGDSSITEETAPETVEASHSDEAADVAEDQKTVPYDRFAEVNNKARQAELEKVQLQARLDAFESMRQPVQQQQPLTESDQQKQLIKQQLAPFIKELAPELGLVSKDDIVRQQADQALELDLLRLEKSLTGKDGRPAFKRAEAIRYAMENGIGNVEVAYKQMHEAELINWHVQQALAKSRGLKTEGSDGSGAVNAGVTDQDLRSAIAKGDKGARNLLFKRLAKDVLTRGS